MKLLAQDPRSRSPISASIAPLVTTQHHSASSQHLSHLCSGTSGLTNARDQCKWTDAAGAGGAASLCQLQLQCGLRWPAMATASRCTCVGLGCCTWRCTARAFMMGCMAFYSSWPISYPPYAIGACMVLMVGQWLLLC